MTWHIYIIKTIDNLLYTGITTNIKRRVYEHFNVPKLGAKFLKAHKPKELVFKKRIGDRSLASKVEYRVKQLSKAQKETIIISKKLRFNKETGEILL